MGRGVAAKGLLDDKLPDDELLDDERDERGFGGAGRNAGRAGATPTPGLRSVGDAHGRASAGLCGPNGST